MAGQVNTRPLMPDGPYVRTLDEVDELQDKYREAARRGIGPLDTCRPVTRSIAKRYLQGIEMNGWITECAFKEYCGILVCEESDIDMLCGHRACHTCKKAICIRCFNHLEMDVRGCFHCRRYW